MRIQYFNTKSQAELFNIGLAEKGVKSEVFRAGFQWAVSFK